MSILNNLTLGRYFPEEERLQFAPYANIAQCNLHNTLTYISKRIGLGKEEYFTEEHLNQLKDAALSKNWEFSIDDAVHNTQDLRYFRILDKECYQAFLPEQKARLKELFDEHLKMLSPLSNADVAKRISSDEDLYLGYCNILKSLINALNAVRNLTTHKGASFRDELQKMEYENACAALLSDPSARNGKSRFSPMKNGIYDSAKRIVTERFGLSPEEVKAMERYKQIGRKFVENKSFALCLSSDDTLTGAGMLFLVCLFLTRKQIFEFVQGLKVEVPNLDSKYVGELLSVFRIVLPQNKLKSIYPDVAYALDMINELRKCPKELFEHISPSDQQRFRVEGEGEGEFQKLLIRSTDRFSYFAQRYIDTRKIFKDIRFQVSLGKYRYKFYDKQCVDATSANRVRILQKELNGFGRIDEMEQLRTEKWSDLIRNYEDVHVDTSDESPYITDQHAGYVVYQNKIGLFYPNSFNQIELEKMDVCGGGNYFPKIQPDKAACMTPVCWLSLYELPALIFHSMICGNDKTEERIKQCVGNYHRFFNDVAEGRLLPLITEDELDRTLIDGYGISGRGSIPTNMVDYLIGRNKDVQAAINKRLETQIDKQISSTCRRLDRLDREQKAVSDPKMNRLGKDSYVEIKPGRIAGVLMEDIVSLMPSDSTGKNKPTGMNYSVMQAQLATYANGDIESLKRMFLSANILQGKYMHPFLANVLRKNPGNTLTFYKIYLEERLKFFEKLKKKLVMGKREDLLPMSFLLKGNKWIEKDADFYRALAKRYLSIEENGVTKQVTIDLPRNLFFDDVKGALASKYGNHPQFGELLKEKEINMAMLISGFFNLVKGGVSQSFYGLNRTYEFYNQVERRSAKVEMVYLSQDEIKEAFGSKQLREKAYKNLLNYQRNNSGLDSADWKEAMRRKSTRLYNEMCNEEKVLRRYKVQDFLTLEMAKRILGDSNKETLWEKISLKDLSDGEKSVFDKPVSFKFKVMSNNKYSKSIKVEDVKIKDMSKVARVKSDNRIVTLLDLIRANEIPFESLVEELNNYDNIQKKVFFQIAGIEDMAGAPGGNFKVMLQDLCPNLDYKDAKMVVNIRNCFSHNSYLSRKWAYIPVELQEAKIEDKANTMNKLFKDVVAKIDSKATDNQ